MNASKRGSAGRPRPPGRRQGGRWLPGPAAVRAVLAAAAALVLFGGLAAVGLAAAAALTAGPTSPSLPPALTPTRGAVLQVTLAPGSRRPVLLTKGAQVTFTTATSGLPGGRPGHHHGHRPCNGPRRGHRFRHGLARHGRVHHLRLNPRAS